MAAMQLDQYIAEDVRRLGGFYTVLKQVGAGGYGIVYAVRDNTSQQTLAIKRLPHIFTVPAFGRRALREVKVLKHLRGHDNIVQLYQTLMMADAAAEDVYMVLEYMQTDLSRIIQSSQPLSDDHLQYFLYQLVRGIKYMHSADIIHRDLKPSNILINANCDLKICDFGLARGITGAGQAAQPNNFMTEYVATRWYRAPEIMFSFEAYTKAVDMWSVGCIFGEMLLRKALFPGKNYVHQVKLILALLGTPSPEYFSRISSSNTLQFLQSLPRVRRAPFVISFPQAQMRAIDLLERLLLWEPEQRLTAVAVLEHPYLSVYHDPAQEPECAPFDESFEVPAADDHHLRELVQAEASAFLPLVL